jgi:hypothetical protein
LFKDYRHFVPGDALCQFFQAAWVGGCYPIFIFKQTG